MKKLVFLSLIAIVVLSISACDDSVINLAGPLTQPGTNQSQEVQMLSRMLNDPLRREKLDGALRLRIQQVVDGEQPSGQVDESLDVQVQISGDLTDDLRAQLTGIGLNIRGNIGDIVSGSIRMGDLAALTNVESVIYVQLAPVHEAL